MSSGQLGLLLATACLLLSAAHSAERHKRLTTFGKAPEKQTQPGKPKECRTDRECSVDHTSCREDKDGKKRCICADGVYPVGGICQHIREKRGYVPKGNGPTKERAIALREPCQLSSECISGAECKINVNATTPSKTKVCLCAEGYEEEDNECNGCIRLQTSGWIFIVLGLSSLVAFYQ